MIALIDIDDVLSDTINTWLKRYRSKFKHKLYPEDILSWDLTEYVVPECGNKIYDLLKSRTLYDHIKPLPHALDGVNRLRSIGFGIAYVTGGLPEHSVHKYKWLKDHEFWQKGDHYIQTNSKFLISGNILIDDNGKNCMEFNGMSILMNKSWNKNFNHPNRFNNWSEIIADIDRVLGAL